MKRISRLVAALCIVLFFGTICYADSNETEPNNDKSQADPLTSGSPIAGQLSSNNDQDWYYICTSNEDVINVKFSLEPAYIATVFYITIEDSLGNVLANKDFIAFTFNDPIETTLSAAVTASGIYYVVITSSGDIGYDANYNLTATVSNPGQCPGDLPGINVAGIWEVEGLQYYFSLNVNGTALIAVTYIPGAGESFWAGNYSEGTWYLSLGSNFSEFDATFTPTSETTATMTVNKCVLWGGGDCILPAGSTVNVIKIF